jgi:hypothetical protein
MLILTLLDPKVSEEGNETEKMQKENTTGGTESIEKK